MKRQVYLTSCLIIVAGAMAGCAKPLFPENLPRSPYERYSELRGGSAPQVIQTADGERPALRERLRPMGKP